METLEFVRELYRDIIDEKVDNVKKESNFETKSNPDSPINLHSSIDKKRYKKTIKLKKPLIKKTKSPLKFTIRNPAMLLDGTKYKYTTIKITDSLYYSIDKWGYIFLNSYNFIPNTYILCKSYVDRLNKLHLLLDDQLILSDMKHPIDEEIKIYMGDKLYKSLMKSNKQFSKLFNKKIAIPFCDFNYRYHIEYITKKHEIGIKIMDKNNNDFSDKFNDKKIYIHSWVIHEVEKFDKDFLIYRLRFQLKQKNDEIAKLKGLK